MARYWLMKSEPFKYGWDDLVAEKEGTWDGVRNYRARNNLAAMEVGDEAFFYHSREGLEIVALSLPHVIESLAGDAGEAATYSFVAPQTSVDYFEYVRIPAEMLEQQ